MSATATRDLMTALRRAMGHLRLYGAEHHLLEEAFIDLAHTADRLIGRGGRRTLTFLENTLYLDRAPMASVSLEFNGLIEHVEGLGVDSIAFDAPVDPAECGHLVAFLIGAAEEPPEGKTVSLNESVWSRDDLDASATSGLRQAYTSSLEALRNVGISLRHGTSIEMDRATAAVKSLLGKVVAQPGAAILLTTVKSHHEYTFYHSVNTSILSLALGRQSGLSDDDQLVLGTGALLHDIGKIGVPASLLQSPDRLTTEGWAQIKMHPQIGAEAILAASEAGQEAAAIVALEHHARYDGKGYPVLRHAHVHEEGHDHDHHGQVASPADLHVFSRIVSVVDTYDAITTRRSYRRAETPSRALYALLKGAGSSHDPGFVDTFAGMMGVYPPGSLLLLEDGRVAMIVGTREGDAEMPPAVLVASAPGKPLTDIEPLDLRRRTVVDQIPAMRAGIDPAAVLDGLDEVA